MRDPRDAQVTRLKNEIAQLKEHLGLVSLMTSLASTGTATGLLIMG